MNPLDCLDEHQLRVFFRRSKTEMSCMDKPLTFLNQLRDHDLIPEERYKNVIHIKNKDKMVASIYKLLDWIETEAPRSIRPFWTCVFTESILTRYPTLKRLQDSLFDGSSRNLTKVALLEVKYPEKERGGRGKSGSVCDQDDQQGHSSSQLTPRKRKKPSVLTISDSEEEEGEEEELQANSSNTDNLEEVTDEGPRVSQNVFRVTCETLTGMLYKHRFASGRRGNSIRTEDRWLIPMEFVKQGSAVPNALWEREIQWEGQPLSSLIENKTLSLHPEQCDCSLCQTDPQDKDEQNDDECFVCQSEGDLVMCDHCPRSFHPKCHLPQVDPPSLEAWMCTFCLWKKTEYRYQMTHEDMLMHSVSSHMLQCHYLLLTLFNADKERIFAHDPSVAFSGYSSHIGTPMWLNKIREQLLDQRYTVKKFLNDIQLIFSNCDQFNKNNTVYRDMGVKLKEFYEQEKEKVFPANSREVQRADGPWTT